MALKGSLRELGSTPAGLPGLVRNTQTAYNLAGHIADEDLVHFITRYPGALARYNGTIFAVINPESFSETMDPQYSRRPVLGLSHEVVQYIRTNSREIRMELQISYLVLQQKLGGSLRRNPLEYRNEFEALAVPAGPRLAPPLVEVVWPGAHLSFTGVVDSLTINYQHFSQLGEPMEYTIDVSFIEVPTGLMTSTRTRPRGIGSDAVIQVQRPEKPVVGAMSGAMAGSKPPTGRMY